MHEEPLYLAHHGIKGQRWGVRRYQNPDGSLTELGKQRLGINTREKHGSIKTDKGSYSRDDDIVVKAGTNAYRINNQSKLKDSDQAYISLNKLDHVKYVESAATAMGVAMNCEGNDNQGRAYSLNLQVSKDLIAPSYSKTMDSFLRTANKYGSVKKMSDEVFEGDRRRGKEFIQAFKNKNLQQGLDDAYVLFSNKLMNDTNARRLFFDDLKKQGYNAIIDDNDFHFGNNDNFTKSPMIIFDSSNVSVKKASKLTDKDYDYFHSLYYGGDSKDIKTGDKWKRFAGVDRNYKRDPVYGDLESWYYDD